jgi:hypothetical protein
MNNQIAEQTGTNDIDRHIAQRIALGYHAIVLASGLAAVAVATSFCLTPEWTIGLLFIIGVILITVACVYSPRKKLGEKSSPIRNYLFRVDVIWLWVFTTGSFSWLVRAVSEISLDESLSGLFRVLLTIWIPNVFIVLFISILSYFFSVLLRQQEQLRSDLERVVESANKLAKDLPEQTEGQAKTLGKASYLLDNAVTKVQVATQDLISVSEFAHLLFKTQNVLSDVKDQAPTSLLTGAATHYLTNLVEQLKLASCDPCLKVCFYNMFANFLKHRLSVSASLAPCMTTTFSHYAEGVKYFIEAYRKAGDNFTFRTALVSSPQRFFNVQDRVCTESCWDNYIQYHYLNKERGGFERAFVCLAGWDQHSQNVQRSVRSDRASGYELVTQRDFGTELHQVILCSHEAGQQVRPYLFKKEHRTNILDQWACTASTGGSKQLWNGSDECYIILSVAEINKLVPQLPDVGEFITLREALKLYHHNDQYKIVPINLELLEDWLKKPIPMPVEWFAVDKDGKPIVIICAHIHDLPEVVTVEIYWKNIPTWSLMESHVTEMWAKAESE